MKPETPFAILAYIFSIIAAWMMGVSYGEEKAKRELQQQHLQEERQ